MDSKGPDHRFADGKAGDALRTIGEVADALGIRRHVLRYWEEQFPMLRPVKRSGGRRYYRPEDVRLVETIDRLVHHEGYTLRGARLAIEVARRDRSSIPTTNDADRSSIPTTNDAGRSSIPTTNDADRSSIPTTNNSDRVTILDAEEPRAIKPNGQTPSPLAAVASELRVLRAELEAALAQA
jgi:DNA-binding transcriptional MerR regulator